MTESSELQSVLPMKCLCVSSVMVPALKSSDHIRKFVSSSVLEMYISPVHFMVEYNVLF
jgi:hypothetical protein